MDAAAVSPGRPKRRGGRPARGQAMVEFALSISLFLVLLLGLIDFARLLFTYISVSNGARELARVVAIPDSTNSQIVSAFNNLTIIAGSTNSATDKVTVTVTPGSGASTTTVTCSLPLTSAGCTMPSRQYADDGYVDVAVTYHFAWVPLFSGPLGAGFSEAAATLNTSVREYIE